MLFSVNVAEINALAPMSASAVRLVNIGTHSEVNINELVRIVEFDGALTANILHWANSAWCGTETPVVSVKNAIVRLGMDMLIKVAVGQCIVGPMRKSVTEYSLAEKELWTHGVVSALTIECMQRDFGLPPNPIAFTAALIHDIGKLLLTRHLTCEKRERIRTLIEKQKLSYFEAEREVLGTDHAHIGGEIGRFWKFPEPLVYAIERHHAVLDEGNPLLDAIQLANAVSKIIGVGIGIEQMNMRTGARLLQRLNLSNTKLERVCLQVKDRLAVEMEKWG